MTSPDQATIFSQLSGSWILDPERTSIKLYTKAMWILKVEGTAKALEGGGSVAADGKVTGTLVIDAASIDTKTPKRDAHLRTADFFETEKYPTITFAASSGRPTGSGDVELTGSLTIHGQTKPMTLLTQVTPEDDAVTVSTEVQLDRSDWGLTWAKMGSKLATRVEVSAHFKKA
jgi:polyisoprenoid-binding protein YceI